jgi:biopolymer transport protein ExbD
MAIDFSSHGSAEPDLVLDINTTPLIDVMLVLLIMLIITIPIQTHAVKLDMPTSTPPVQTVPAEVVRLDIDFDGTILWNGEAIPSLSTLETRFKIAADQPVQPELHLRPHKLVEYDHVAAVLASAQRVGITKIGLVGSERFLD